MQTASKVQLSALRKLRTKKGRRETGLFMAEGVRLCEELATAKLEVETVLVTPEQLADKRCRAVAERLAARGAEVLEANEWQIAKVADTVHCQGILAAAHWQEQTLADVSFNKEARVLLLDRVSDPGNVGAIIRTGAWFGISAILLGQGCADLLNPKTVRSTMGGIFHLPVLRDIAPGKAVKELLRRRFSVAVAAIDGDTDWQSWCAPARSLLILGSEAHGVAPELHALASHTLAIPRAGTGESLNVAVSAGIFLSVQ